MTDEQLRKAFDAWLTNKHISFAVPSGEFYNAFVAGAEFGAAQQKAEDIKIAKLVANPLLYSDGFVAYNACYLVADDILKETQ